MALTDRLRLTTTESMSSSGGGGASLNPAAAIGGGGGGAGAGDRGGFKSMPGKRQAAAATKGSDAALRFRILLLQIVDMFVSTYPLHWHAKAAAAPAPAAAARPDSSFQSVRQLFEQF